MSPFEIARACHEVNRHLCIGLGDNSHLPWEEAPAWQLDSAIRGVEAHLANPSLDGEGSHKLWMKLKLEQGWTYGEVKDEAAKTHPCIRSYNELPIEQRVKDYVFKGVVAALGDR